MMIYIIDSCIAVCYISSYIKRETMLNLLWHDETMYFPGAKWCDMHVYQACQPLFVI